MLTKVKSWFLKISYALIPLVLFVVTLMVSFFFNMWFGKSTGLHPFIPLDHMIPTVSQFVYIYYLTFPVLLVPS